MPDRQPTAADGRAALIEPGQLGEAVIFRSPGSAGSVEMDELLRLYREAIPARERKPEGAIRDMVNSPDHRVEVAIVDGRVVGFFLLYRGQALSLLEYMATSETLRGRGLGAALYARARSLARPGALLVEVDSDDEPAADQLLRRRRIAFYRRLGCRAVSGFDFVLPLPGEGAPPRLKLLVDADAGIALSNVELRGWLREIYTGVYGAPPDDPRLRAMIGALPPSLPLI